MKFMRDMGWSLYWLANVVALLLAIGTVVAVSMGLRAWLLFGFSRVDAIMLSMLVVPTLLIWLFGRLCRHFLVDRPLQS
jgi:hypothetical protein